MARSRALSCGTLPIWTIWPIMSRPCWFKVRSRGMSVTRSWLASWVAIQLPPITWSSLAHQPFSTVQTSTSLTSRLVRGFAIFRGGMERRPLLCVPSRDWLTKAEQFYAARCFYDEDQARYPGRVSTASPASLARTPGRPQTRRVPALLHLSARHGTVRLYGGRRFSALPGNNGSQQGQRTLGGPDERYFNSRTRGGYRFSTCA